MAHKIVITDGIVLQKRGVGEAHTQAAILTREVGLVYARATSARRAESKLRYGLEPYTVGRYSLVRGRNEWKIVGVEGMHRDILKAGAGARAASGRAGKLHLRLVAGEEAVPELFDAAVEGFILLASAYDRAEVENIECMLVLRILWRLGYVATVEPVEQFLGGELTSRLIHEAAPLRPALIRAINESLAATGL